MPSGLPMAYGFNKDIRTNCEILVSQSATGNASIAFVFNHCHLRNDGLSMFIISIICFLFSFLFPRFQHITIDLF